MNSRVLVVGGAGYIGSHMVLALKDRGLHPIVFDNLSRGYSDTIDSYCTFIHGDLIDISSIRHCMREHPVDVVIHFAALAYVGESVTDPAMYYQNNFAGTLNLLDAMREVHVNKIVFSSTCATYGVPEFVPINEFQPQRPINPYGHSKLMVEQVFRDYAVAYNFNSVSLRYFNAAGADPLGRTGELHTPETHLIPLVLSEALRVLRGGPADETQLCVNGLDWSTPDGSCIRDYVHVSDLCHAHILAMNGLLSGQLVKANAFNLANDQGVSVLDVIECCRRVTGVNIQYRVTAPRVGDPPVLIGDARAAQEQLGWVPKMTSIDDMVKSAWFWMQKQ